MKLFLDLLVYFDCADVRIWLNAFALPLELFLALSNLFWPRYECPKEGKLDTEDGERTWSGKAAYPVASEGVAGR